MYGTAYMNPQSKGVKLLYLETTVELGGRKVHDVTIHDAFERAAAELVKALQETLPPGSVQKVSAGWRLSYLRGGEYVEDFEGDKDAD